MTDTITKPRVSAAAKTALVLAAAAVLLAVFALAAPGSRFFFPLVSLWLFACVLLVLRVAGIKFDLFHKAVIVGLWAAALIYFFWALNRRSFVYIWDYVNYINKQYSAEAAFLQSPAAAQRRWLLRRRRKKLLHPVLSAPRIFTTGPPPPRTRTAAAHWRRWISPPVWPTPKI